MTTSKPAIGREEQPELLAGQPSRNETEFALQESGVFIRTSWILAAKGVVTFPFKISVRYFTSSDAAALANRVRKRNVFARHSWENNFYLNRVEALANKTIIEVLRPGQPDDFAEEAQRRADIFETLAILSCTRLSKRELLRDLGLNLRLLEEVAVLIGGGGNYLRAKTKPPAKAKGLLVDSRFEKRFQRYGFANLFDFCNAKQALSERVSASIAWLRESRLETRLQASIVKTSIALETLLIYSESEPLARSLSERAAFILSADPVRRQSIHKTIRKFYDARSGIVHGGRDKSKLASIELLETVDRLVTMLNLTVAANAAIWTSPDELRNWCESERWGAPSANIVMPYPDSFLRKALENVGA